jgi:AcrR family transcriptional regulator
MNTARALLDEGTSLRELSLNELARRASMTKSNVYRYFESREAVLLALLVDEWTSWFEALRQGWPSAGAAANDLDWVMKRLARTTADRPRLGLLTSALPSVLEQNLSEEAIREFKLLSRAFFDEVAAFVATCSPELSRASALQLLQDGIAIIVGLYPLAHPAEAVVRAMRTPELQSLTRDYSRDLERFLLALARDLVAREADSASHGT